MVYIIDCSVFEILNMSEQREFLHFCKRNFLTYLQETVYLPQVEKRIVKKFQDIWFKDNSKYTKYSRDYWISFIQFYNKLSLNYRIKKLKGFCKHNLDFIVISFNKDETEYYKQFEHYLIDVYIQEDLKQYADFNLKINNYFSEYFLLADYNQYDVFQIFLISNIYI